ncbi:MAG: 3-deoxy-D-manno-octulosonic acid transferase [Pseudomonas marincola]
MKRLDAGKEDPERYEERFGEPSRMRPAGELIWIHAASVGESISALPLIKVLLAGQNDRTVLITTGSVTSAKIMADRLPTGAFHQFVPIDTKEAVNRFLDYWQPQTAIWLESEIWPNLIFETSRRKIPMMLLNARMTSGSFGMWRKTGGLIKKLLKKFDYIHAQSSLTADRLEYFGVKNIETLGNLKFCSPPLPFQKEPFRALKAATDKRKVWLAASTHKGEEAVVAQAHIILKQQIKSLLTVIVPRHPERADEIQEKLTSAGFKVARRSLRQKITDDTDFYLADTIGELGLFYRICDVVFIGGSLADKGGQNPLEAARLSCAIMFGPNMSNFSEIVRDLLENKAALQLKDGTELAKATYVLMTEINVRAELAYNATEVVKTGEALLGHIAKQVENKLVGKD